MDTIGRTHLFIYIKNEESGMPTKTAENQFTTKDKSHVMTCFQLPFEKKWHSCICINIRIYMHINTWHSDKLFPGPIMSGKCAFFYKQRRPKTHKIIMVSTYVLFYFYF